MNPTEKDGEVRYHEKMLKLREEIIEEYHLGNWSAEDFGAYERIRTAQISIDCFGFSNN